MTSWQYPVRPVSGVLMSTLRWRCQAGSRYDKALCCRYSSVRNSERSLHDECLQPKPAWCLKQLRADVEPMIIFWVGLGGSPLDWPNVRWESLYLMWLVCIPKRCSCHSHHVSNEELRFYQTFQKATTFLSICQILGQSYWTTRFSLRFDASGFHFVHKVCFIVNTLYPKVGSCTVRPYGCI